MDKILGKWGQDKGVWGIGTEERRREGVQANLWYQLTSFQWLITIIIYPTSPIVKKKSHQVTTKHTYLFILTSFVDIAWILQLLISIIICYSTLKRKFWAGLKTETLSAHTQRVHVIAPRLLIHIENHWANDKIYYCWLSKPLRDRSRAPVASVHCSVSVLSPAQNLRLESAVTNNIADKQLKNSCNIYITGKNE